jgi:hypothetical protein
MRIYWKPETHAEQAAVPYPTKKLPDTVDEILRRLAQGETYARIHRSDPNKFPLPGTWSDWLLADEDLSLAHRKARQVGFDIMAEDCLDIADDSSKDTIVDAKGNVKLDAEWAQRSKLRVWTRLQLLRVWDPTRYGDKVMHSGDADNPVVVQQDAAALARELVGMMRVKVLEQKP